MFQKTGQKMTKAEKRAFYYLNDAMRRLECPSDRPLAPGNSPGPPPAADVLRSCFHQGFAPPDAPTDHKRTIDATGMNRLMA
jgi:hypothetical protein